MATALDQEELARLLPGTWAVAASNFPMWLDGSRRDPTFNYEVVNTDPLIFADTVEYTTTDGEPKNVVGVDTLHNESFVWRGRGWFRFFSSRWTVSGASDDGTIMVVRFSKSHVTPAGLDIVVRDGHTYPDLRARIAHATTEFGLSPEDFASLAWFAERR